MKVFQFLGERASEGNPAKLSRLHGMREDYQRVVAELNRQIDAGENPTFPSFVDGAIKTLRLSNGFIGSVLWDLWASDQIEFNDARFNIRFYQPQLIVPDVCELRDVTAGLVSSDWATAYAA